MGSVSGDLGIGYCVLIYAVGTLHQFRKVCSGSEKLTTLIAKIIRIDFCEISESRA